MNPGVGVISITSRPRTEVQNKELYANTVHNFNHHWSSKPEDLIIYLCSNGDAGWGFDKGEVPFLTRDMKE